MLRKLNHLRSLTDNLRLAFITAFSAGMVNVLSLIVFFAFTSNVTGHYAILAQEIAKGNWYQAAVVCVWISLFFLGNFVSSLLVFNGSSGRFRHLFRALPLVLEIACLVFTGIYLQHFYSQTLQETEMLVAVMLFAMGLQNGLTASISNFNIKTTHLTGLTTDLGILLSMFIHARFRKDVKLREKAQLLFTIVSSYMVGGIFAGLSYSWLENGVFYIAAAVTASVIVFDYYQIKLVKFNSARQPFIRKELIGVFNRYESTVPRENGEFHKIEPGVASAEKEVR